MKSPRVAKGNVWSELKEVRGGKVEGNPQKKRISKYCVQVRDKDRWVINMFRTTVAKKTGRMWGVVGDELLNAMKLYVAAYEAGLSVEEAIELIKEEGDKRGVKKR